MNELVITPLQSAGELAQLIHRAADSLVLATTAAEVLEARDMAEFAYDAAKRAARLAKAKDAHDEIAARAHRAQADALEILAKAKRKLADEYDAAQERGEVAGHGGKRGNQHAAKVGDDNVATVADIGLTRPEVFEARQIRDAIVADPDVIRRTLDDILEKGEEPTKALLRKALAPVIAKERKVAQSEKKERRVQREISLAAKIEALPTRRYGVILADPEWRFEPYSRESGMDRSPDNHYPTSGTDDIAARDVPSIAADDCVLFLWATAPMLPDALRVMAAWGFEYKSHLIWAKERSGEARGTGYWFSSEHELLLVGTKGNVPAPAMGAQWRSLITARVEGHSEKPEVFLEMVEDYFPTLPKIELNRRGPARKGWDAWGLETDRVEDAENRSSESILGLQGLRATPPEGAGRPDAGLLERGDAMALLDRAIDDVISERAEQPSEGAAEAEVDLYELALAIVLEDPESTGDLIRAAAIERRLGISWDAALVLAKCIKADEEAEQEPPPEGAGTEIVSRLANDHERAVTFVGGVPDPVAEAVIAAGLAPNAFILDLNRGLTLEGEIDLPSRLFRHPVEFMDSKRTGGESRLLLRHPRLRDYLPVADFLDDIEAKTGIRPEWQAEDEFGRDFGALWRWYHAVDLCSDKHFKDLLRTAHFTEPECIFNAVNFGLSNKCLSVKNARAVMAHLGSIEPDDRSAEALAGKGLSPYRDGSKKYIAPNISLRGDAGAWLTIHGMEDGWLGYVGKFLSVTAEGMKRREKDTPVEIEPPLLDLPDDHDDTVDEDADPVDETGDSIVETADTVDEIDDTGADTPTLPPAPGHNAPIEMHVGHMRNGSFARLQVRRDDDGRFTIATHYEIKGFCQGPGPIDGTFMDFSRALAAALASLRMALKTVADMPDGVLTDQQRGAAKGGVKWIDGKMATWGLAPESEAA
jgi:N6-adenosine-specific RNA methylase IME4